MKNHLDFILSAAQEWAAADLRWSASSGRDLGDKEAIAVGEKLQVLKTSIGATEHVPQGLLSVLKIEVENLAGEVDAGWSPAARSHVRRLGPLLAMALTEPIREAKQFDNWFNTEHREGRMRSSDVYVARAAWLDAPPKPLATLKPLNMDQIAQALTVAGLCVSDPCEHHLEIALAISDAYLIAQSECAIDDDNAKPAG